MEIANFQVLAAVCLKDSFCLGHDTALLASGVSIFRDQYVVLKRNPLPIDMASDRRRRGREPSSWEVLTARRRTTQRLIL